MSRNSVNSIQSATSCNCHCLTRKDYFDDLPRLELISLLHNVPNLTSIDVDANVLSDINFDYYTPHEIHSNVSLRIASSKNPFSIFHCNIRSLSANLFIYLALPTRAGSPQQHMPITVGPFCLTHPVNFPCGRKPEYPGKTHDFRQSVDFNSFRMRTGFESH